MLRVTGRMWLVSGYLYLSPLHDGAATWDLIGYSLLALFLGDQRHWRRAQWVPVLSCSAKPTLTTRPSSACLVASEHMVQEGRDIPQPPFSVFCTTRLT